MCGIAGTYGTIDPGAGARMLERIVHRGPDEMGQIAVGDRAWLGHTRLSIVDVDGGRQPLATGGETMWLVGNGEVYNHEDVRQTFDGQIFSTRSDNEVALHLINAEGPDAISQLSGMYAFLGASEDGRFIAARDPVGIKPLYWAEKGGSIRFASEMRAFDPSWLPHVEIFPPGHYWTPRTGLKRFEHAVPERALKQLPGPEEPSEIPEDILRETREVIVSSVDRQMMGDVPVGVFLSGGLDSSLVAAIAADYLAGRGKKLQTFAVGTENSSDLLAARQVAEHLDTEHHERIYTAEDATGVLPEVVRSIESFDPSLVRSAVPNYMLAEFTAKTVKVVLTGEGADEIFAGYSYYHEQFKNSEDLQAELIRTIEGLHNLNLQRADRVTMAHGLEARVPFLDREVIAFGLHLPAGWKAAGEGVPEKRLLREAFDGWLPHDLLWRKKEQFGEGSGALEVLGPAVSVGISDEEFEDEKNQLDPPIRTKEELAYFRILREALPGLNPEETIGRFAEA